jgi:hypothetical protein
MDPFVRIRIDQVPRMMRATARMHTAHILDVGAPPRSEARVRRNQPNRRQRRNR